MNYIMNTQGWMISTTKSARKESSHYYTVVTYGQYYNQIVNHPKKDKTLFYVVTKKTIMTTQRITLGKNLDSFFNINYNKLMNDITNAQEQSQNYTLPPDVLRDLVVGNSKLNKNKLNKLLKMNSNGNGNDNDDSSSNESDGDDDDDDKDDDDKDNDEDDNDDGNNDDNNKKMIDVKSPKKAMKNVSLLFVLIFSFNIFYISCLLTSFFRNKMIIRKRKRNVFPKLLLNQKSRKRNQLQRHRQKRSNHLFQRHL